RSRGRAGCRPRPRRAGPVGGLVPPDSARGRAQAGGGGPAPGSLVAAGRALALLRGRDYLVPQDVFDVAFDVLRHRLVLSYEALAEGVDADAVLARVLSVVTAPAIESRRSDAGDSA
ncbi:MAG: hypothetical protein KY452_07840, partial [Actinobacteria bacterium]|nr:hypothetical protein [Actinomycetota bacterium]